MMIEVDLLHTPRFSQITAYLLMNGLNLSVDPKFWGDKLGKENFTALLCRYVASTEVKHGERKNEQVSSSYIKVIESFYRSSLI